MEGERTEFDAAYEAGKKASQLTVEYMGDIDRSTPLAVIPADQKLVDLSPYLPNPLRHRGQMRLADAASFAAYVNRFKDDDTLITATEAGHALTAYMDFSRPDQPRHADHTATLVLQFSEAWRAWTAIHKKAISQLAFAEFLEEHVGEIAEPAGGALSDVAERLEATKTVTFRGGQRTSNGSTELSYIEQVEAVGGQGGSVKVPERLVLVMPMFEGGEPIQITARLRYRISQQGVLTFIILLNDVERLTRAAFRSVLEQVAKDTGLTPLLGSYAPTR